LKKNGYSTYTFQPYLHKSNCISGAIDLNGTNFGRLQAFNRFSYKMAFKLSNVQTGRWMLSNVGSNFLIIKQIPGLLIANMSVPRFTLQF
jgi:hypothetical protein